MIQNFLCFLLLLTTAPLLATDALSDLVVGSGSAEDATSPTRADPAFLSTDLQTSVYQILSLGHDRGQLKIINHQLQEALRGITAHLQNDPGQVSAQLVEYLAMAYQNHRFDVAALERLVWLTSAVTTVHSSTYDSNDVLSTFLLEIISLDPKRALPVVLNARNFGLQVKAILSLAQLLARSDAAKLAAMLPKIEQTLAKLERESKRSDQKEDVRQGQEMIKRMLEACRVLSLGHNELLLEYAGRLFPQTSGEVSREAVAVITDLVEAQHGTEAPDKHSSSGRWLIGQEKNHKMNFADFESALEFLEFEVGDQYSSSQQQIIARERQRIGQARKDLTQRLFPLLDAVNFLARAEVLSGEQLEQHPLRQLIGDRAQDPSGLFSHFDGYRSSFVGNQKLDRLMDLDFTLNLSLPPDAPEGLQKVARSWSYKMNGLVSTLLIEKEGTSFYRLERQRELILSSRGNPNKETKDGALRESFFVWEREIQRELVPRHFQNYLERSSRLRVQRP